MFPFEGKWEGKSVHIYIKNSIIFVLLLAPFLPSSSVSPKGQECKYFRQKKSGGEKDVIRKKAHLKVFSLHPSKSTSV